jgi:hypothetical protein
MRDRSDRKVQLSQSAYTTTISQLSDKRSLRHDTPMAVAELQPHDGAASMSDIRHYQRVPEHSVIFVMLVPAQLEV